MPKYPRPSPNAKSTTRSNTHGTKIPSLSPDLTTPSTQPLMHHSITAPKSLLKNVKSLLSRAGRAPPTTQQRTAHRPSAQRPSPRPLQQNRTIYASASSSPPSTATPHSTLSSFLTHAHTTNLSRTSTTYQGTLYEYLTQTHLRKYGFELTRTGGRGDTGIDLQGTWGLRGAIRRAGLRNTSTPTGALADTDVPPSSSSTLSPEISDATPVLIQCKHLTRSTGLPNLIRELEGAFLGAPTAWRGEGVLGVMVCTRPATKGVRDAMGRSRRGLVWVTMEAVGGGKNGGTGKGVGRGEGIGASVKEAEGRGEAAAEERGRSDGESAEEGKNDIDMPRERYQVPATRVVQFLYNAAAASQCGLEGVNVGVKYDDAGSATDIQLLWQGKPLDF